MAEAPGDRRSPLGTLRARRDAALRHMQRALQLALARGRWHCRSGAAGLCASLSSAIYKRPPARWPPLALGDFLSQKALQGFLAAAGAGLLLYMVSSVPVAHAGGRANRQLVVSVRVVVSCSIATYTSMRDAQPEGRLVHVVCRGARPYSLSYARVALDATGRESEAANSRYVQTTSQIAPPDGQGHRVMLVTVNF